MESLVRILPESRPTILVGSGEMSFGNAIPEVACAAKKATGAITLASFSADDYLAKTR